MPLLATDMICGLLRPKDGDGNGDEKGESPDAISKMLEQDLETISQLVFTQTNSSSPNLNLEIN
jgi:hypothetical protein